MKEKSNLTTTNVNPLHIEILIEKILEHRQISTME